MCIVTPSTPIALLDVLPPGCRLTSDYFCHNTRETLDDAVYPSGRTAGHAAERIQQQLDGCGFRRLGHLQWHSLNECVSDKVGDRMSALDIARTGFGESLQEECQRDENQITREGKTKGERGETRGARRAQVRAYTHYHPR
jgi:hypothetical protein